MNALWERPDFRRAAGDAWRPGGVELTRRALAWCASAGLLAPGGLVFDLGSGAGATLRLLTQMGYRAVGLDKHAEAGLPVDAAPSADVHIVRADLERPPLTADSCDCIVCECVLSLLHNPLAALRAACRALRPGGVMVVSDLMLRPGYERPGSTGCSGAGSSRSRCSCSGHASAVQSNSSQSIPPTTATAEPLPEKYAAPGSSCLAGARPESAWRGLMEAAGLRLLHYEDNSRALVELAARMIWYGDDATRPVQGCKCGGTAPGKSWRAYGYGLWIARKETP
ncbi:class I SAM-dependent methyltransferase [Desulfovibrio sp. UIB00]|uniref:DVU_1556 family methyltransferase n=1 Tax=Desulfovibrio sp. UIB00 TaxID=2804314 RepID=UPI001F0F90B1|nr:methyltransferase domain-containing protein [Desulfovibrio sp. UIB00]MCH5145276.1 class I SAM-dependent methyltransferase [Desulfovibrio sp. UIB00]